MSAALIVASLCGLGSVCTVCFTAWKVTERKTTSAPVLELTKRLEELEASKRRADLAGLTQRR